LSTDYAAISQICDVPRQDADLRPNLRQQNLSARRL
jgi:hypothetical protein